MDSPVRVVTASVELVHVERGLWCGTCLLPSARTFAVAVTVGGVMSLAVCTHCDDCSTTVRR